MNSSIASSAPLQAAPESTRLSWTERIAYGFGDVGSCLYFAIFMNFLAYFYTDIYGISAGAVGTMLFVVRTYDWIKDPIMGAICDRTKSRMGRYRPWLLWMIVPYVVFGILTFTTFDLSPTGKLVYAYTTYILLTLVYTMINVPFSALMGVMTANSEERTILSTMRMIGAGVASLVVYGSIFPLMAFFGGGNNQKGFTLTVVVYAVLAAGSFLFTFLVCKERIQPLEVKDSSLKRDLRLLRKNVPWLILIAVSLLTIISMGMRAGTTVYYFKYLAGNEKLAAGFFVVSSLIQIVSVSFTKHIAQVCGGKKAAYIVLMLAMSFLSFMFFLIPPANYTLILIYQVLMTIVCAPLIALYFAMIADSAGYGMWKYGQTSTGLLFSAGTFSLKIGWSIGPASALWILGFLGFAANQAQSPQVLLWIKLMMSVVPGLVAILAVGVLYFYKINGRVEKEIEQGLRDMGR
jgi:GPH family glycoside/pentoside/hexuronide:cation symporter